MRAPGHVVSLSERRYIAHTSAAEINECVEGSHCGDLTPRPRRPVVRREIDDALS